jgi:hypothetical protein
LVVTSPDTRAIIGAVDDAKQHYDIIIVDARVDSLSSALDESNDVYFVSSNRPTDPAELDSGLEALAADIPRFRGTILTAKGISTSTAAVAAHVA